MVAMTPLPDLNGRHYYKERAKALSLPGLFEFIHKYIKHKSHCTPDWMSIHIFPVELNSKLFAENSNIHSSPWTTFKTFSINAVWEMEMSEHNVTWTTIG